MFIQIEETPNPNSLKFLPGVPVYTTGILELKRGDNLNSIPLAGALFEIKAIKSLLFGLDFITITKKEDENWVLLKPKILGILMEHFSQDLPLIKEETPSQKYTQKEKEKKQTQKTYNKDEAAIIEQIEALIETRIRPAVAKDGGDIIFHDYQDGIVTLTLRGACSGCPSASMTLKSGIERMLQHYIPEISEVRASE